MFHHPLFQNGLVVRLKIQTVTNSRLHSIHKSQTFSSIFEDALTVVERVVKFDTLGTTFIPRIFEAKDWVDLFGNFEDPIDELVKEFYSNANTPKLS